MQPPILRLLAPNPGPWTGEGTNSWLIGAARLVLVDPGPDLPAHEAALISAIAGRKVEAVIVTHAHRDHSALAPRLARQLGAPLLAAADAHGGEAPRVAALGLAPGPGVDTALIPDIALSDETALPFAEFTLLPLHTPGHLGGHFCLGLGDVLFSGDHVMGWSTSVVTPPEGDMARYRASLARLAAQQWRRFLPGHGPEIADPAARLAALIAHRNAREAEVLAALDTPARAQDLTARIYPGLDPRLAGAATGNILAHLLQLAAEGKVERHPGPLSDARFARAE